jgi:hypothetical protein
LRVTGVCQRLLSRGQDFLGCALRSLHFAHGLLGEDRGEISLFHGGKVSWRGQTQPIAETEGLSQSQS